MAAPGPIPAPAAVDPARAALLARIRSERQEREDLDWHTKEDQKNKLFAYFKMQLCLNLTEALKDLAALRLPEEAIKTGNTFTIRDPNNANPNGCQVDYIDAEGSLNISLLAEDEMSYRFFLSTLDAYSAAAQTAHQERENLKLATGDFAGVTFDITLQLTPPTTIANATDADVKKFKTLYLLAKRSPHELGTIIIYDRASPSGHRKPNAQEEAMLNQWMKEVRDELDAEPVDPAPAARPRR